MIDFVAKEKATKCCFRQQIIAIQWGNAMLHSNYTIIV